MRYLKTHSHLLFYLFMSCGLPVYPQSARAPEDITALIRELDSEMKKQHVAGMMLSVVSGDSVFYSGGIGYADLTSGEPVSGRHLFRQASVTKLFVALGTLRMEHDGKLSLQARLRDIAPEIRFRNNWEDEHPVTIEQLLEHSTGLADKSPFDEYDFTGKSYPGVRSLSFFEPMMSCRWKPGERHAYSGVNYAILGYVIEKISGQSLDEYLRKAVFTPLGMNHANVNLSRKHDGRYATGYVWQNNHFQVVPHQPQYNPAYGSLNASAEDYTNALLAYVHSWKTTKEFFLPESYLEQSEKPHTYLAAKAGLTNTYGYGNEGQELDGYVFRGHRGAIGGYLSALLYNRQEKVGYGFCINTHNEAFYRYADARIRAFLLQHFPIGTKEKQLKLSPAIQSFTGYYRLANPGQLYTGFLERMRNTFRLDPDQQSLQVHLLPGGSMQWVQVDSSHLLFRNIWANHAHIAMIKDETGQPVILDQGLYFKKISAFGTWAPIIGIFSSIALLISGIIFGLISILLYFLRRPALPFLVLRILPAIAAISLLTILSVGSQVMELMKAAQPMDGLYTIWVVGKWAFLILSVAIVILLSLSWKKLSSKALRMYLLTLAVSACYLCILFITNHWY